MVVALSLAVLDLDGRDQRGDRFDVELLGVDRHLELQGRLDDRPERPAAAALDDQGAHRQADGGEHEQVVVPPAPRPHAKQHHGRGGFGEEDKGDNEVGLAFQPRAPVRLRLPEGGDEEQQDAGDRECGAVGRHRQGELREHPGLDRDRAVGDERRGDEDHQPARRPERQPALQPAHPGQVGGGEEHRRHRQAEVGRRRNRAPREAGEQVGHQDAWRGQAVDGEDRAHRHEPEAQEQHAVEADLDRGHGQDPGHQRGEERDRRDDVEVLVGDDDQLTAPGQPQRHEAGGHRREGEQHQAGRGLTAGAARIPVRR